MNKKKISFLLLALFLLNSTNGYASDGKQILKQTGGVFTGILISPMVGGFRGFSRGSVIGTNYTAELYGNKDGPVQRMAGVATGGITMGFLCGAGGFMKGMYQGVEYGIKKPFSKENYAWTGNSLTDYPLGIE